MSGIVGVYYLDGPLVDNAKIEGMLAAIAHRGPDGAGTWCEGSVGFGHRMLWTTPESLNEKMPRANRSGDLVITADARIDNRDELMGLLGIASPQAQTLTDSELILAAYEAWGDSCTERLIGDFAFAIWNRKKRTVFCARDHFGIKPFYYHLTARLFAFASEIKALLCLKEVPTLLNELRVAGHLTADVPDAESTFYSGILRLAPSHDLSVSLSGSRLRRYWELDPARELPVGSSEEYAEALRDRFTEAVRCRLRSAFPVGSFLSGGLDSSSITCVARNLLANNGGGRLHTFSSIFDKVPECDERPYINAVTEQGGSIPHFLHADEFGPLSDIDQILWHNDEVFFAGNINTTWRLYNAVREQGVRVVLDGFDGDTTLSHGFGYLMELARAKRWITLLRESHGYAKPFEGLSTLSVVWMHIARYGAERYRNNPLIRQPLRHIYRAVQSLQRRKPSAARRVAWRQDDQRALLNEVFAQEKQLRERVQRKQRSQIRTERDDHHSRLTNPLHTAFLELMNNSAAAASLEPRFPFWDKRLVEFCLALPSSQKLHQGWNRYVMRRAMDGILPPEVQWRGGKADMSANFEHGLRLFGRKQLDSAILKDSSAIEKYVNIDFLHDAYQRFLSQKATRTDMTAIWRSVSLALWLRTSGLNRKQTEKGGTAYAKV